MRHRTLVGSKNFRLADVVKNRKAYFAEVGMKVTGTIAKGVPSGGFDNQS